ncbi:DUF5004 domain-containing protein [Spongiivirga citrea]|uniref:DUF5004 domain-containing protein n=1 Tax=Spongiivirga citrea TaxID=1481457 RepID=A0A6M0CJ44_9FLAO|nr:DUF5004 domain-containing protein [Spongiivirga citrea]NER17956.1 DUF5004 domain-containing protein [Spongiivirga citrea]
MKLNKVLGACLTLLIISCSSDDNGDTGPSQEELNQVIGTWQLSQVNVSAAQDVDNDGDSSVNLIEELSCLDGTLTFTADFKWSLQTVNPVITSITNDQFAFSCDNGVQNAGSWALQGNIVLIREGVNTSQLNLSGTTLTEQINENLPMLTSKVYQKN